jgi:5-formyltetrahydrofolate cyclo-ligase
MPERDEKAAIRARMRNLRNNLGLNEYRSMSMDIVRRCVSLDEYRRARTIQVYVASLNNEVDTVGLICRMFDEGKRVVVPRCADEPHCLLHVPIDSLDSLKPGRFGIMEPVITPGCEIGPAEFDLIIAPVVAFDRVGGRIGFGGGYYDTLFAGTAVPKVGLAYSFQEVAVVPLEPHDHTLDIIVTEKEIIRAG